jgi:Flp pilus assembly protein CpaB
VTRQRRRSLTLLGLAAALVLVALTGAGGGRPAPVSAPLVRALVVQRALAAGARIEAADLRLVSLPAAARSAHQLTEARAAVGRRVAVALAPGEPLMDAELAGVVRDARARDVALRLDDAAGVPAGDLAGTRADVYLTLPRRGARPILVLTGAWVVNATSGDGSASATVRVPRAAVAGLIAAESSGSLRLVARPSGAACGR